jgi:hypothetical protein
MLESDTLSDSVVVISVSIARLGWLFGNVQKARRNLIEMKTENLVLELSAKLSVCHVA